MDTETLLYIPFDPFSSNVLIRKGQESKIYIICCNLKKKFQHSYCLLIHFLSCEKVTIFYSLWSAFSSSCVCKLAKIFWFSFRLHTELKTTKPILLCHSGHNFRLPYTRFSILGYETKKIRLSWIIPVTFKISKFPYEEGQFGELE